MKRHSRHLVASGMMALALSSALVPPSAAQTSVVDVPPPQVLDYWVSISRQPAGVLVFDGYVPDDATRTALGTQDGADISWLKLGSGAPEGYAAALDFGLGILDRLAEGRFALRGSVMSISGVAASQADFIDLNTALAAGLPSGLILAKAEITAPRVESYAVSLRRQPNGNVILSGYVPSPQVEQRLLLSVGARTSSTLRFASGEPLNFDASLDKALPLFALLQQGEIRLENGSWLISGTPATASAENAIRESFEEGDLSQAGWSLALAAPAPAAPVEPYRWTVEKRSDGGVAMTGSLPTEAMQRVLALRLDSEVTDETSVVAGAPQGFIARALAGVDALAFLEIGRVTFDGTQWLIEGEAKSPSGGDDVAQALASAGEDWSIAISKPAVATAPAQAPVAGPAEAPVATAPAEVPAEVEPQQPPAAPVAETVAPQSTAVETPPAVTTDNLPLCRTTLAELSAQNGILFRSGAAVLAEGAETILQAIADATNLCPGAAIDVAGHTDSDGEADANLALSVARAEAVVTALVGLGVAPERLYAIGYGEAAPVADNATSAGKTQNRRIVVSVREGT